MIGANTVLNDRYRLVSVLAKGGMGVIWRGWDKRSQNVVAVKVLKDELSGQETFLARLRAEAINASRLHHPNLAAVFDWGETEGQGWIVMELVEGRPLSDILAGGHTLSWDQLAPILMQVAGGLQAAHAGSVIHRDVKPSNILISDKGVAKLTDFGISLAPRAEALTAVGMVMGTAQYLPPEQAMGHTATAAGDIYALGVIAYEALAGKRPFTGSTQVDIALAHVKNPVPPLPNTVAPEVAQLVYAMLEKDPALRPASAAEVQQRIRLLWHGEVPPAFTPRMSFARPTRPLEPTQGIPTVSEPDHDSRGADALGMAPHEGEATHPADVSTTTGTPTSTPTSTQPAASPGDSAPPVPLSVSPRPAAAVPASTATSPARPGFGATTPPSPRRAAIPVSRTALENQNRKAAHRLEPSARRRADSRLDKHSGSERSKIIAAIVITAVVLMTLIIGLITSTQGHSASARVNYSQTLGESRIVTQTATEEDCLDPVG
ncbi:serine/threonine-protein kinase [Mobiluncus mulieris]|uniref:serine/threonine-protein kinase n=1 Tax=Mobiluncus mulieris TaxID=2052 RepID=UPI0024331841|nr:serine/threonine-protein kinase [Mobiluncus mulieris]